MKAAVYEGPGKIDIREVPTPSPGPGEVLIDMRACSVCGTDIRIYEAGQKNVLPPRITGHEIAGVVSAIGKDVKGDFKVGDKVTAVTCVGCFTCRFCRQGIYNLCDDPKYLGYFYDGGFAEKMLVPAEAVRGDNIVRIGGPLSFEEIALIEPLSCCINGQEFLRIQPGDTVAVLGAGPIGGMHTELARAAGAEMVILADVLDSRLELSQRFRIDHRINSAKEDPVAKILDLTKGRGADVVIVAAGATKPMEQALAMVGKRGRISLFASAPKADPFLKFDANVVHYKEVGVFGVFASNRSHFVKARDLLLAGKVDAKKFVTHTFPLEKVVDAIKTSKSGVGLKSLVKIA